MCFLGNFRQCKKNESTVNNVLAYNLLHISGTGLLNMHVLVLSVIVFFLP